MNRDFLKCLGSKGTQPLQRALDVFWDIPSMLSQAVYTSAFAFTFVAFAVLQVQFRTFSGLSWIYVQPCACVQPYTYPWPSRFPVKKMEMWCSKLEHLIPQIFPLRFFAKLLFTPAGNVPSGSCEVKQLLLIVFDKCSIEKAVGTEWGLSQVK